MTKPLITTEPITPEPVAAEPVAAEPVAAEPILVLLHGWGCDSHTWAPVLDGLREFAPVQTLDLPGFGNAPALADFSLDATLAALAVQLPERCVLMGWSLGGMLAVQLAARLPRQVAGVVCLAANARFVASNDYPQAMSSAVNHSFTRQFIEQPQAALKLFCGLLAQGDQQERQLLKQLRANALGEVNANWQQALALLSCLDNRALLAQLPQPLLHLLAEGDALVPIAAANALLALNPAHQVQCLAGAGHALHWSQSSWVVAAVRRFYPRLTALPASLSPDKKRIAQSFGKAAASYDAVAGLQRAVGAELLTRLPLISSAHSLLDLGSGTGYFTAQLAHTGAAVIGLDIAQGMLAYARQQHPALSHWLCADAEHLPLAAASVDVIFSSLAIQWCANLPQLMQEVARVLKPGGCALLSTLGPGTLVELKRAWQQVDSHVHVNHFAPRDSVQQAVQQAGLVCAEFREEIRRLHFEQVRGLTHELKALGAHNINPGQPQGLTGRQRLQAFSAAYERERTTEGLPVTYEVYYLVLTKAIEHG